MKEILHYSDYRAYLRDYIQFKKAASYISNRWFAQKVGINSSSWLTSILQGKKGLSKITANKISKVLKHSKSEAQYFESLVFFNQAKTAEARNHYYSEIVLLRKAKKLTQIKEPQYEYYTTWYHSVIRSIIGLIEFKDDFKKLSRLVSPTITESQVKKSVEVLEKLQFIKKNEKGYFQLTTSSISTGEHVRSLAITNFQQETMKLAWEALDRYPKENRDISTLTLGISKKGAEEIKKEILDFRKRVTQIASEDDPADRVCQLNLQFFPMSQTQLEKKGGKDG